MAKSIEIKGRAKYVVVGGVLILLLVSIISPPMLSQVTGSGGRGFSFFRSGFVVQHKTNLIGHWVGTAKGNYATGFILAAKGETIVVKPTAVTVREGRVALRLRQYNPLTLWDYVWSGGLREGQTDPITIQVPATGVYDLRLGYVGFAGSIEFDWHVE